MDGELQRAVDRLAVAVTERPADTEPSYVQRRWGTVTDVNVGPPASVTVELGATGVTADVRYLASYPPLVGDLVVVEFAGTDPIVLGALA